MLAVAINKHRMGYVFLIGNQLKEWRTMTKPTKSQSDAAGALQDLINTFKPDVVVTEQIADRTDLVSSLKRALIRTAAQNYALDVSVPRKREFRCKYEEAAALSRTHPEIAPWVPPKRKFFDHEPHRMILFDALALANVVLRRPTQKLAAAMR